MRNRGILLLPIILVIQISAVAIRAESMTFDQSQWATGDMNEQAPSDSGGGVTNSHVDYFYYYERMPMCMTVIGDSLAAGSSTRTYDSALLSLVIAADGLSGTDSMRIFGKRLVRLWSEYGVSWNYHHGSVDSAWNVAGGDINSLPCMDTIIVDTSVNAGDTLCFHLDTGFVREMIEGDNYGWLMMAENIVDRATFQFYTEDVATPAYRPVMTVFYTEGTAEPGICPRRRRLTAQIEEVIR